MSESPAPVPKKPTPPAAIGLGRAGANAAAASFASLTSKLDYLSPADLTNVRLAYRFADQAHLGQLRNCLLYTSPSPRD